MITLLPIVVLAFAFGCDASGYDPLQRSYALFTDLVKGKFSWDIIFSMATSWNISALFWYIMFIAQLVTFAIAMPGDTVQGTKLRDGSRLTYKLNGKWKERRGDEGIVGKSKSFIVVPQVYKAHRPCLW